MQMLSLVDALVLCHEQFFDYEQGQIILAHNDLKPENILVFHDSDSLVGTWKIADFGLSKVKPVIEPNPLLLAEHHQQHSFSRAIRPPGGYTAPEIIRQGLPLKNSSSVQCDIWSYGCILAEVLVFSVGGSQAVRDFNDLRLPGKRFNYHDDCYFEGFPDGALRLKKPLLDALIQIRRTSTETWVQQLSDLIFEILKIDRNSSSDGQILKGPRPKASTIRKRLHLVQQAHRQYLAGSQPPMGQAISDTRRPSNSTISTSNEPSITSDTARKHSMASSSTSSLPESTVSVGNRQNPPYTTLNRVPRISINDNPAVEYVPAQTVASPSSTPPTTPTSSMGAKTSIPLRALPIQHVSNAPSCIIQCMKWEAVQLGSDASLAAFWSRKQASIYSLSSKSQERLFDHKVFPVSNQYLSSVSMFGSTIAITADNGRSRHVCLAIFS